MGMLEGMIIGGVCGGLGTLAYAWHMSRWKKKFLTTLSERGTERARSVLDKHVAPVRRGKFPLNKLLPQRARFAGLTLLDQMDDLRDEMTWHQGGPAYKMQVRGFGLMCMAVRNTDPGQYVEQMDALVKEIDAEANAMQRLIKDKAQLLGHLMRAMSGTPLANEHRARILKWSSKEGSLEKAVMYYAVVRADTLAGLRDEPLVTKLRELTNVFALQDG